MDEFGSSFPGEGLAEAAVVGPTQCRVTPHQGRPQRPDLILTQFSLGREFCQPGKEKLQVVGIAHHGLMGVQLLDLLLVPTGNGGLVTRTNVSDGRPILGIGGL